MIQFEVCHFRSIEMRNPTKGGSCQNLPRNIMHANLDVFWAREPGTVYIYFLEMRSTIKDTGAMQRRPPFPERGHMTLEDISGMSAAISLFKIF